jgi:hypothetical protein
MKRGFRGSKREIAFGGILLPSAKTVLMLTDPDFQTTMPVLPFPKSAGRGSEANLRFKGGILPRLRPSSPANRARRTETWS